MLETQIGFNTAFSDRTLFGCNVILKDPSNNTLIDNKNIVSCNTKSRNNYLCNPIPSEETTIKITGWKNISNTIKTYLSTMDNEIWIYYKVSTYSTLQPRVCYVADIEIDYKQQNAVLKCVAIHQRKKMTSFGILMYLYCGDYISSIFQQAIDIQSPSTLNVVNDAQTDNIWLDGTYAEYIQNCAIACGGTFKIYYDYWSNMWAESIIEMPASPTYNVFDYFNVYDDISINDSDDLTASQVSGYTFGDVKEIFNQTTSHPNTTFTTDAEIPNGYVATEHRYGILSATPQTQHFANNKSYSHTTFTGNYQSSATEIVKGKPIISPQLLTGSNMYNILATFVDDSNITQKSIIKTNADRYLSLTKDIEFSCRINPAFEPLDFIKVNYIGYVMIEEIDIDYKGGFSGRIKGKLINEPMKDPNIVSKTLTDRYHYSIKISNRNYNPLKLWIHSSAGDVSFDINPSEQVELTYLSCVSIATSVEEYIDNNLSVDVYCYFEDEDGNLSNNVILLEANA